MNAHDNGACPHCGRADSVREREKTELYNRAVFQPFECLGCSARWTGVRRPDVDSEPPRVQSEARA